MPKGNHYGYTSKRDIFINDLKKLTAREVKAAIQATANDVLPIKTNHHTSCELLEHLTLDGRTGAILLNLYDIKKKLCYRYSNASASNKLYLVCPQCSKNRQYLITVKSVMFCRECLPFHYRSQSENKTKRIQTKIFKLQTSLSIPERPPLDYIDYRHSNVSQPKWMRYSMYMDKKHELFTLQTQYFNRIAKIESPVNLN